MNHSTSVRVGLVLAGLLGLLDLVGLVLPSGPAPTEVIVAGAVLGLATVAGVVLAWRGSRAGIVLVIVTRLLSALGAVPALFVDEVPTGVSIGAGIGIVVTLVAVGLVSAGLRRRVPAVA